MANVLHFMREAEFDLFERKHDSALANLVQAMNRIQALKQ